MNINKFIAMQNLHVSPPRNLKIHVTIPIGEAYI